MDKVPHVQYIYWSGEGIILDRNGLHVKSAMAALQGEGKCVNDEEAVIHDQTINRPLYWGQLSH